MSDGSPVSGGTWWTFVGFVVLRAYRCLTFGLGLHHVSVFLFPSAVDTRVAVGFFVVLLLIQEEDPKYTADPGSVRWFVLYGFATIAPMVIVLIAWICSFVLGVFDA